MGAMTRWPRVLPFLCLNSVVTVTRVSPGHFSERPPDDVPVSPRLLVFVIRLEWSQIYSAMKTKPNGLRKQILASSIALAAPSWGPLGVARADGNGRFTYLDPNASEPSTLFYRSIGPVNKEH